MYRQIHGWDVVKDWKVSESCKQIFLKVSFKWLIDITEWHIILMYLCFPKHVCAHNSNKHSRFSLDFKNQIPSLPANKLFLCPLLPQEGIRKVSWKWKTKMIVSCELGGGGGQINPNSLLSLNLCQFREQYLLRTYIFQEWYYLLGDKKINKPWHLYARTLESAEEDRRMKYIYFGILWN